MIASAFTVALLVNSALALPSVGVTPVGPLDIFKRASSGCGTSGAASCSSTKAGSCCFEAPGGLLLQTQFWDTNPTTGPSDSWTIHGLWPDNCDGTFTENCDPSRDYTDISSLLTSQGASSTLSFMETFWVDINGQNEQFWEHEWSTHGTCYSTLEPSCLPSGSPKGAEAVAFFETVVKLFQTLPTFESLSAGGVTPSNSKTYTLATMTNAIKDATGVTPSLDCDGSTVSQISYYFNVKGSLIDGEFVPIDAAEKGSCPSTGIKYPLKSGATSVPTTTAPGGSGPTGTPGSLPAKAHLQSSTTGGLLTAGTWSVQTPATYTLSGSTTSFTMSTSKGACAVSGGALTCGSGVSGTTFSAVASGANLLLAVGGSTAFTSDSTPSGTAQETVFTGSAHAKDYTIEIVAV